jgi:hypothetical protein
MVLLACVIIPMAIAWMTAPGLNWIRPYLLWALFVIAAWLWQRRRESI